jgi:transposase
MRICVFGTITMEGKQLFRKYYLFNQETFLDYLKQVKKRLENNVIMFTDRARQRQSKKVQKYLRYIKDSVRIFYLPKGSPEFNAVEECWRQSKIMYYQIIIQTFNRLNI